MSWQVCLDKFHFACEDNFNHLAFTSVAKPIHAQTSNSTDSGSLLKSKKE